jgi:hypothetical protein
LHFLASNKSHLEEYFHTPDRLCAKKIGPQIGELMMALKKRRATRRGWSRKDLSDMRSLAKKKTPARAIARHLKRSEGAVRQKAYAAGISLSLRKRRTKRAK